MGTAGGPGSAGLSDIAQGPADALGGPLGHLEPGIAEQVLRHLSGARWFAGKGRLAELTSLTPLPWLTAVGSWPAVRMEIAGIGYAEEEDPQPETDDVGWPHELYQLAVSYHSAPAPDLHHAEIGRWTVPDLGPVVAYDAAQDPAACTVLLDRLVAGSTLRDHDSEIGFHLTAPGVVDAGILRADLEPRPFRGQQSNTSVMFGDQAMVKLFRRIELGHNLDIEVHDALSRNRVADVARLYGWVNATWVHAGEPLTADLAMAVEQLRGASDGWGLALESLQHQTGFAEHAGRLGAALAEIHEALRQAFGTSRQPGIGVAAVMKQRLAAAAADAPALEPHVDGLLECFNALAEVELGTQRVHGDFHLGQTLLTASGWKIIDFEGEPAKTLAERAMPDSVWRDIAGMLRSFDYAGASVPGPASQDWVATCRTAFLDGYAGGRLSETDAGVLRAYEADKAVYEVVYEVRNRPDWVGIPLAAVAALAQSTAAVAALAERTAAATIADGEPTSHHA